MSHTIIRVTQVSMKGLFLKTGCAYPSAAEHNVPSKRLWGLGFFLTRKGQFLYKISTLSLYRKNPQSPRAKGSVESTHKAFSAGFQIRLTECLTE